jgi:hypothetical protein
VTIKLTDAAEFFNKEPHQIDAWNWLQSQLTPEVLESFSVKYRNNPAKESTLLGMLLLKQQKKPVPSFLNVLLHSGLLSQAGVSISLVPGITLA